MNLKEKKCSDLFDLQVDDLIGLLKSGQATTADRKVIIEFLKNNGITAETRKGKPLPELLRLPFTADEVING